MKFKKIIQGKNVIYSIEGNMGYDSLFEIDHLRLDIKNTALKGAYNFIWDLHACPIISEPGLAAIVMSISQTMRSNTETVIFGVNNENLEVLKSFHMDNQIRLAENLTHALGEKQRETEILDFPDNVIDWI